jgi:predicted phage terminase large subunit-like protein
MSEPLRPGELELLLSLLDPLRTRNCPLRPSPRQEAFLLIKDREVFYGGAAGGGKSVALLMAALQYSDVPGYDALLLRPSLIELQLAGGLIELAHDWLAPTKARWLGETKTWRFPGRGKSGAGGATLTFGYLADAGDVRRYAGSSFSMIGFDELTRFEEHHYRLMHRALRQATNDTQLGAASDGTTLAEVPVRLRATSNPGGPGHQWVKNRFVDPATRTSDVVYLPSRLADNPHLDQTTYIDTLAQLPTAERERLLHGDWEIPDDGELFQRAWFTLIEPHQLPTSNTRAVRYWDPAATEPGPANPDPDWTVGLLLKYHRPSGTYYIADIVRERKAPGAIERLVADTAKRDGRDTQIVIEQEPGAAGKAAIARYKRHVLKGHIVYSHRPTGDKTTRAWQVAAAAENGLVQLVNGRHAQAFLDELSAFPHGKHDDLVDALAGAHQHCPTHHGHATAFDPSDSRIDFDPLEVARRREYLPLPGQDPAEQLACRLGVTYHPGPPRRTARITSGRRGR